MTYCARVRFNLSQRARIHSDASELVLRSEDPEVRLVSTRAAPMTTATQFALIARPFRDEAEALEIASQWRDALMKAFATLHLGATFGDGQDAGGFTKAGFAWLKEHHNAERVLNDRLGIEVFECEPWPKFARIAVTPQVGKNADRLVAAISDAAEGSWDPYIGARSSGVRAVQRLLL